jgi:TetR/AcrR family transcriptional regulator, cholesterol catabolism regulator
MTEHESSQMGSHQRIAPKARQRLEPVSRYGDIVDAAAELFSKRGYAATTIQDIADAVGILPGSLYHYIHSKEDLLYSIVEEVHRQTGATIEAVQRTEGDAVAKLATFIRWHLAPTDQNIAKARVFYSDFGQLSPERAEEVQRRRDEYDHTLRAIIVEGQEQGLFAEHLNPLIAGMAVFGILNFVTTWYRPGGPLSLEEITEAFTDMVLRSVSNTQAEVVPFPPKRSTRARKSRRSPADGGE